MKSAERESRTTTLARTDDVPNRLQEIAAKLRTMETSTTIQAYDKGHLYSEATGLTGDRNFSKWCKPNTGYTRGHAYKYINIFERFSPYEHRQRFLRLVDQTGAMLLAQPKYEPRIDEILTALLARYGPGASIQPLIITSKMVREFLRGYEPEKEYPEYEDEETGILVVKGEAGEKNIKEFFRALAKILEHWTPETYSVARDKIIKHVAMPHFTDKQIKK